MTWQFELLDPAYGGVAEGPIWHDGKLIYTHIQASRIMCFDPPSRTVSLWRDGTNCSNGLCHDLDGNILACQGGAEANSRQIARYGKDGSFTVLASRFEGKRFNIPNDVVVDPSGRIWFTDPFYEGAAGPWSKDRTEMDLDHESVYRLDPQSGGDFTVARVTFDTTRPNGLLFSLDYRTLYVAQSGRNADELRQLRAYPVHADGSLGTHTVLHDFGQNRGIDGMRLDADGNIVATAGWESGGPGPSIYVFAPTGEVLERHPIATRRPTNCCFGGEDLSTLYVTTIDGELFRAQTHRRGRPLPPARQA